MEVVNKVQSNSQSNQSSSSTKKVPSDYVCIRCGSKARHYAKDCFAINLECNKCSKVGHIAKACKSKMSDNLHRVTRDCNREEEEDDNPTQYITINATKPVNEKLGSSNGKSNSSHFL